MVATAYGAMYAAREGLNQDGPNAYRYRATKDALIDVRKKFIDQVRQDIQDGDNKSHNDFVDSIRAIWL